MVPTGYFGLPVCTEEIKRAFGSDALFSGANVHLFFPSHSRGCEKCPVLAGEVRDVERGWASGTGRGAGLQRICAQSPSLGPQHMGSILLGPNLFILLPSRDTLTGLSVQLNHLKYATRLINASPGHPQTYL